MKGFFGGNRFHFGHPLLEFLLCKKPSQRHACANTVCEYKGIEETIGNSNHMDWSSVPLPWAIAVHSLSVVGVS